MEVMDSERVGKSELKLQSVNGFEGGIHAGLNLHPDGQHLVYPIGCSVVVENIKTGKQDLLSGHKNNISCVAISKTGAFIASGQVTDPGFKADTMVWRFDGRSEHCRLAIHRNRVQDLCFSPNEKYLVTLGGPDDGSLVVWDVERKEALCGSPAQSLSAGLTCVVRFLHLKNNCFVTAGNETLRAWIMDERTFKLVFTNVSVSVNRRVAKQVQISKDDGYFVCGTSSGDLLAVNLKTNNFQLMSPEKERLQGSVTALALLDNGRVLVGSGKGKIALLKSINEKFKKTDKFQMLDGSVTSIAADKTNIYAGTSTGNVYHLDLTSFHKRLIKTSHYSAVHCICFPHACSDLLVSSSLQDIRLWETKEGKELLRLSVANKTCNVVAITRDGKSILSGWDDGCIRAYYPESGRLMYVMDHTYGGSVTSLATFNSGSHVISGSNLGHVVLWEVPLTVSSGKEPIHVYKHTMLKEHKGEVTSIRMKQDDSECITSSIDGSCIFWDLSLHSRRQMIRLNTLFKAVCYHPLEHQVLTAGTDRKIGYWETYDASMVRQLEGCTEGSINCLDVSSCGNYFVSGGDDRIIKVWLYDEGEVTHEGTGHSAAVTRVCISPDNKFIFSCSLDGAILKWTFPFK